MYHKIVDNIKKSKIKSFMFFYILYIFIIKQLDILVIGSEDVINSINLLLNIIALGCGVIYYKIRKNKNIFIFNLFYTSVFIESAYWFSYKGTNIHILNLMFMYRAFLLYILISKDNRLVDWIMQRSEILIIPSVILNILLIKFNEVFLSLLSENANTCILYTSILVSYFILTKLIIKIIRNNNFIEQVFLFSILLLGMKLWLIFLTYKIDFLLLLLPSDAIIFFLSFSSILIALFIENNFTYRENEKLNDDVQLMTNNIEHLKEIEQLRIQFFANLSHELKTPINIIYSSIQLLELKKKSGSDNFNEVYKVYDPILKQNCFRMIRLTNNLVDMTKINAGYFNLEFKNVDIVSLVEDITMSVVHYVEDKKINIIFDTLIEEHIIKCNVDAVERIILNLLSNAIKFSYENSEILVYMTLEEGYVVIKVRDYGKGVAKDKRESIFELFVQEDKSLRREKEGSGIGLSLVKSLVELHGGKVYLSDVEVGTEVIFELPDVKIEDGLSENLDLVSDTSNLVSKINIEFSDIYNIN